MRLLFIRHGDPDYEHDSLTDKGRREAELLAERLSKERLEHIYVSPLGRAAETAAPTLERLGRTAEVLDWLREFPAQIDRPDDPGQKHICWDWLPDQWTRDPRLFDGEAWLDNPVMAAGDVRRCYEYVTGEFDALLASLGCRREGKIYVPERPNHETAAFFCHFGVECVLLSRILSISPMVLWHGFCAAPSSVTTVYTEERRRGCAGFRVASFGDISHLWARGEEPAFSARFCECWTDDTRHD